MPPITWPTNPASTRTAAEQVEQEPEKRARVIGAAVLAVKAVCEDERLQVRRIERAVEELAETARREGDEVRDLSAAQAAESQRELQHLAKSREAVLSKVRRRLHEQRLEVACEPGKPAFHRDESLAVRRREFLQQLAHARVIAPPGQHHAVRHHGLHRRLGRDHAKPCLSSARSRMTSGRSMLAM
jgi:hypothetical protein